MTKRVVAAITGVSANWRVEFEEPARGNVVRVDLYQNDVLIDGHDVRWCHHTEHGSYLANCTLCGSDGWTLRGTPLYMLGRICSAQLGIVE